MLSLRVDNSRLNQLVNRGHTAVPENTSNTSIETNDNKTQQHRVTADQKPDLDNLSFPAKSLGINYSSVFKYIQYSNLLLIFSSYSQKFLVTP